MIHPANTKIIYDTNLLHRTKPLRTWITHLIRKFLVFREIKGSLWHCFHLKIYNYFIQTSQLLYDSFLCISLPWIHMPSLMKSQPQSAKAVLWTDPPFPAHMLQHSSVGKTRKFQCHPNRVHCLVYSIFSYPIYLL